AMALKKAAAQLAGVDFHLGVAEDPAHADKPYYIPAERVQQAQRMLAAGRLKQNEFGLTVDFVLADGPGLETIGPGRPHFAVGRGGQELDVGAKACEPFAKAVGDLVATDGGGVGPKAVVFHNGVFGMFEDPRFESGAKQFNGQLKRMTDAGLEVYVGGGEGGT